MDIDNDRLQNTPCLQCLVQGMSIHIEQFQTVRALVEGSLQRLESGSAEPVVPLLRTALNETDCSLQELEPGLKKLRRVVGLDCDCV